MKKKPQQCKRQGKSNANIKTFLSNLKENDLHFEDSQITQCVFLGVLRLKPVPSVFSSNNVPSVVVEHKSKRYKNNNSTKEVNKNVSRKKDINKVISGRIGKKNPDRIKASVKKLPTKKPVIKLKFNMNKTKKDFPPKDLQETVRIVPESLTKITPESVFTNKTITLNSITTVPTFNPVQNLFDKLKQQLDDKYNRPSSTEVSRERLFLNELDVDTQKSSRKQKKISKKNKPIFERLIMPLLPSSSSSFSDNGYFSSSSINAKSTEDVILFNEEDDNCEVLLNTGPMPNFVLEGSSEKVDNDIILIPDDNSNRSSPNRELIVVDDVRNIRISPRLNKSDQNGSNTIQQNSKDNLSSDNVINVEDCDSNDKDKNLQDFAKKPSEKPRKRRTLMPTSIPSMFFNTPRLLRSELGQKKGTSTETKHNSRNSTSKLQKSENKQEKPPVKQRKEKSDLKTRSSTENLIYEVVKSTETTKHSSENCTRSQDHILVVDSSPPKVEPLIIKLKKSTEKSSHITDQNGNEEVKNKDRTQKSDAKKVTKNLFFPRLLRSDINQQKEVKLESVKKPTKSSNTIVVASDSGATQKISELRSEKGAQGISPEKNTVKSAKQLSEEVANVSAREVATESPGHVSQFVSSKTPTQKVKSPNLEKVAEEKISSNSKKAEKSPLTPRRMLRSDITQEQNNSSLTNTEDGQNFSETDTVIEIIDNSKPNSDKNENVDNNNSEEFKTHRQLRSDESQKKSIDSEKSLEKSKKNASKAKNSTAEWQVHTPLRSESPQKKSNTSEIINVDETDINNEKSKKNVPKAKNIDAEHPVHSHLTYEFAQKTSSDSEIIDVDQTDPNNEKSKKHGSKGKNGTAEQQIQIQLISESPQKKSNASEIINVDQNDTSNEKSKKNVPKAKNFAAEHPVQRHLRSELPQKTSSDSEIIDVDQTDTNNEKSKANVSKSKKIAGEHLVPRQLRSELLQKKASDLEIIDVDQHDLGPEKSNTPKGKNVTAEQPVRQLRSETPQKPLNNIEIIDVDKTDTAEEKSKNNAAEAKDATAEPTTLRQLRSELPQKKSDCSEIIDVDKIETVEETPKKIMKAKNIAVVQPMSRQPRSEPPQKQLNDSEIINGDQAIEVIQEKPKRNLFKTKSVSADQSVFIQSISESPQKKSSAVEVITVGRFYSSEEKTKKDTTKSENRVSSAERRQLRSDDIQKKIVNIDHGDSTPKKSKADASQVDDNGAEQRRSRQLRSEAQKKATNAEVTYVDSVEKQQATKDLLKLKKVGENPVQKESNNTDQKIPSTEIKNENSTTDEATQTKILRSNITKKDSVSSQVVNEGHVATVQEINEKGQSIAAEETKIRTLRSSVAQKDVDVSDIVNVEQSTTKHDTSETDTSKSKVSTVEETKTRALRSNPAQKESNTQELANVEQVTALQQQKSKKGLSKNKEITKEQPVSTTFCSDVQKDAPNSEVTKVKKGLSKTKQLDDEETKDNQPKSDITEENTKLTAISVDKISKPKKTVKGGVKLKKALSKKIKTVVVKKSAKKPSKLITRKKMNATVNLTKTRNITHEHDTQVLKSDKKIVDVNISKKPEKAIMSLQKRFLKTTKIAAKKAVRRKLRSDILQKKSTNTVANTEHTETQESSENTKEKQNRKLKLEKNANEADSTIREKSKSEPSKTKKLETPDVTQNVIVTSAKTIVSEASVPKIEKAQKKSVDIIVNSNGGDTKTKVSNSAKKSGVAQKKSGSLELNSKANAPLDDFNRSNSKTRTSTSADSEIINQGNIVISSRRSHPRTNSSSTSTVQKVDSETVKKGDAILNSSRSNSKTRVLKSESRAKETEVTQKKSPDSETSNKADTVLNSSRNNSKTRVSKNPAQKTIMPKSEKSVQNPDVSQKKSASEITNQGDSMVNSNKNNSKTRISGNSSQKTDPIQKKSIQITSQADAILNSRKSNSITKLPETKQNTQKATDLLVNKNTKVNIKKDAPKKIATQQKIAKMVKAKQLLRNIKKARISKVAPIEVSSEKSQIISADSEVPVSKFEASNKRLADLEITKQADRLILHSKRSVSKPSAPKSDDASQKASDVADVKTTVENEAAATVKVGKSDEGGRKKQKQELKENPRKIATKIKKSSIKFQNQKLNVKGKSVAKTLRNEGKGAEKYVKKEEIVDKNIDTDVIDLTDTSKNTKKVLRKLQKQKTETALDAIIIVDKAMSDKAVETNKNSTEKITVQKPKEIRVPENKNKKPRIQKSNINQDSPQKVEITSENKIFQTQLKVNSAANISTSKVAKKKSPQKKQEDFDVITVVPEKRVKKQINISPKILRSSINPFAVKQETVDAPAPVVEKVVALIHSEPKPKQHYATTEQKGEMNAQLVENVVKNKPRMLRSQHIHDNIETIVVVKDGSNSVKARNAKENKKFAKKKGVSQKSKVITKNKTALVAKRLKSGTKTKATTKKQAKKEKHTVKKVKAKSKLQNLSNKSKQKVLKEVKLKLRSSTAANPLKNPFYKSNKKSPTKQKKALDWQNNDIIERIIQEIKNTIFKQEPVEDAVIDLDVATASNKNGKQRKNQGVVNKNSAGKQKKSMSKTQVNKLKKSGQNKRKVIQAAKKKMMQTKEALKRKLRSTRSDKVNENNEENKSSSSDLKENNQPLNTSVPEISSPDSPKKEEEVSNKEVLEVEEIIESPSEEKTFLSNTPKPSTERKNDSVIIINEISIPTNVNIGGQSTKRKNTDLGEPVTTKRRGYRSTILSRHISATTTDASKTDEVKENSNDSIDTKKKDITVFDFDESEPEVTPLRHKSTPKASVIETPIIIPEDTISSKNITETVIPFDRIPISSSKQISPPEPVIQRSSEAEGTVPQRKPIYSRIPITSTNVQQKRLDTETSTAVGKSEMVRQKYLYSKIDRSYPEKQLHSEIPTTSKQKPAITILQQKRLYSEILVYSDEEEEEEPSKSISEIVKQKRPLGMDKAVKVIDLNKDTSVDVSPESVDLRRQELLTSRRRKLLVPFLDDDGKPKKLWSIIDSPHPRPVTPPKPILIRRPVSPPRAFERRPVSLDIFRPGTSAEKPPEPSTCSDKKSPLKQPTIIEMFSKVWMKKEHPLKSFSEESVEDMDRGVFTRPPLPPPPPPSVDLPTPSPRRERCEDEDSDTESRAEWIPEEYAEYKFKYSAHKMMQYKPIFKCKICMTMFPSYYKLLKHRKEHEKTDKPYNCAQCGTDFANVDDFSAHLRIHKGKHPYICPKCDSGFWTKSAYEAHIPVHVLKKAKQPIKKFRCDVCAKEFSKLCDVERHTRVHTGEKPCICNICNKRFQQAHNLSKHLLTHLHIKPFHCEICNKQFGRNDVLRRHLLTHSVDKPVKCSVCFRGFIRHSQLLQHLRRKHRDYPIDDFDMNEDDSSDNREDQVYTTDFEDQPGSSSFGSKETMKTEA